MYYIGIDLGTSSVKLILMKEDGKIEKTVTKDYPIYFPKSGWSEQNPNDWYSKTIEGIKDLIEDINKDNVKGIGIAGQMHGLVMLDEYDNVIRPAILWNDSRTKSENDYLNNIIGKNILSKNTGNISFTGFTASKILWVKNNEPINFEKIKKIMLPKDYIIYKLTGEFSTDVSDASGTLLFDVKNKCWSEYMLDVCGLEESVLPNIYESIDIVGKVKKNITSELDINSEVIVIAGAGDNAAAAIGTGTIIDGSCNISLGTSGTVFISSDKFIVDEKNAMHSFAHANGKYHLMGCMLSAASCNKWWSDNILNTDNYSKEQEGITKLGENEVYFLPYLMGERSPHNDPNARGMFIGISMNTTRNEMTQAVLEGVAFALKDIVEIAKSSGINIQCAKICGGGSKSSLWVKIISNILNMKIDILEAEEGPALGVAILAAVACGEFNNLTEAVSKIIKISESIIPNELYVKKYERKYEKFTKIYPVIKKLYIDLC